MTDGASGSFPQAPPAPSLVGTVLDGRYRIVKLIGEGGMGEVYAAEHVHIEKRFAIKLLKQEIVSNPEAVTRFRQEARSSSSIGHRNIIAIEDFGQLTDGRIYMCMELLERRCSQRHDPAADGCRSAAQHPDPDRPRARGRAREGHRPSRHEAREHLRHDRRAGRRTSRRSSTSASRRSAATTARTT